MKNENKFCRYFYDIDDQYLFVNYSNKNILNFDRIFIKDYDNNFIIDDDIPMLKFIETGLDLYVDWNLQDIRNTKLDLLIYKILGITDEL